MMDGEDIDQLLKEIDHMSDDSYNFFCHIK